MAQVLSNFLVGVGMDYNDSGEKKLTSSLSSVKSKALQLGAVLAGGFGVSKLTSGFADANDRLGKFSQKFGVIPDEVSAMGRVIGHEGGNLTSFIGQLESLIKIRDGIKTGASVGIISELGKVGFDANVLVNAKDGMDAFIKSADKIQNLSEPRQRLVADLLGLDDAGFRLMQKGSQALREQMALEQKRRPVTGESIKQATVYNDQMQTLGDNLGSYGDIISNRLLTPVNELLKGMNGLLEVNKAFSKAAFGEGIGSLAENFNALHAAGALIAGGGLLAGLAGMAKFLPIIGGALSTAAASAGAIAALGAAGAAGYYVGEQINDNVFSKGQKEDIGRFMAQIAALVGGKDSDAYKALNLEAIEKGRVKSELANRKSSPIVWRGDVPVSEDTVKAQAQSAGTQQAQTVKVQIDLKSDMLKATINEEVNAQNKQSIEDIKSSVER